MKIYVVSVDLIPEDKHFNDLTDEEVVNICDEDNKNGGWMHCKYGSIEEFAAYWNLDEILYPNMSYMRVIND